MAIHDNLQRWRAATRSLDDIISKKIAEDRYDLKEVHVAMAAVEVAYGALIDDLTDAAQARYLFHHSR